LETCYSAELRTNFGSKPNTVVVQLIKMFDQWADSLEVRGRIDVIYTDLDKAFDKVSHRKLIEQEAKLSLG